MSKPVSLNRTVQWFNKTEGRDKICKTLQYGSRFLMWHLQQKGKSQEAAKFQGLFKGMQQSRKLFRLAKSLNEFQSILDIIGNKNIDEFTRSFQLLQRFSFCLYWFYDNVSILSAIKFLERDPVPSTKTASTFWFLALIFGLILAVRDLYYIKTSSKRKSAQNSDIQQSPDYQKLADLKKREIKVYLTLLKTLGDLLPASQGSQIYSKLTGKNLNDGAIGLGGLVSAVISAYEAY